MNGRCIQLLVYILIGCMHQHSFTLEKDVKCKSDFSLPASVSSQVSFSFQSIQLSSMFDSQVHKADYYSKLCVKM